MFEVEQAGISMSKAESGGGPKTDVIQGVDATSGLSQGAE